MTTAPRFRLHGMTSPNVRKIVLMLEELEAPYEIQPTKVFRGDQFTPEFRALNPFSKVPVLTDRETGQSIFESGAILIYLAETFGRFLPTSGPARYETLKWLFAQTSNIGPMFGQFNHFRLAKEVGGPYAFERYRNISAKLYAVLNERLGAERYLAGPDYSIADIATVHWAGYVDTHEMNWSDFPHLKRWCDAIAARPAARREAEIFPRLVDPPESGFASMTKTDADRFFWRD
jgi:GST-like protein